MTDLKTPVSLENAMPCHRLKLALLVQEIFNRWECDSLRTEERIQNPPSGYRMIGVNSKG